MHKCQQTFSQIEDGEPEITDDPSVDSSGTVTCEVRITRVCSDCGTEVKEANLSLEGTVEIPKKCRKHELEAEAEAGDFSMTSRVQDTDRKGRKIRSSRYMKSYYGVEGEVTVKCATCNKEIGSVSLSDEVAASGMDELE